MGRRILRVTFAAVLLFLLLPVLAFAQNSDQSITVTSPKEGDAVVNTSVQINGTAPPSTIVSVVITDTDTTHAGIVHQEGGKVQGTVTAGSDGVWTYVPQHTLVPGQFSVEGSYTNGQNQAVASKAVNFTVLNSKGSSAQISNSSARQFIIWGSIAFILVVLTAAFIINRRRHKDVKRIDNDAQQIETELEHTVEQLTKTNQQIADLNKKIADKKGSNGPAQRPTGAN